MKQQDVIHRNVLAEGIFEKFELRELKLFLALIANVKKDSLEYFLDAKEIKRFIGMDNDSYKIFEKCILNIQSRKIIIPIDKDRYESYSIFSILKFDKKEKTIKIIYNPFFFPFLVDFDGNFCKYKLKNIKDLTSKYSVLFYMLCKSRQFKKEFILSVNEINLKIGKVIRSNNLDKIVLTPVVEELNRYTDLNIEITKNYETSRKGRSISGYKFNISKKIIEVSTDLKKAFNKAKKNIFISRSKVLNDDSIQILLDEISEFDLINGLNFAYKKINKDFSKLEYLKKVILSADKEEFIEPVDEINKTNEIGEIKFIEEETIQLIEPEIITESINNPVQVQSVVEITAEEENKILEHLVNIEGHNKEFLILMKGKSRGIYYNTLKNGLKNMKEFENKKMSINKF